MYHTPEKSALTAVLFILTLAVAAAIGSPAVEEKVEHHGQLVHVNRSLECIACHDGTVGRDIRLCTTQCDAARDPHSTFRAYPPAGKEQSFVPMNIAMARGVVFENGKISCISCHNLRNTEPNHLVVAAREGKLCTACHIH